MLGTRSSCLMKGGGSHSMKSRPIHSTPTPLGADGIARRRAKEARASTPGWGAKLHPHHLVSGCLGPIPLKVPCLREPCRAENRRFTTEPRDSLPSCHHTLRTPAHTTEG